MDRGSVQHGARLDDDLAAGVDEILQGGSGVDRDDQAPELPVEGELIAEGVNLGVGPREETEEPVGSLSPHAARRRSELARFLIPALFPADGATIVGAAQAGGAPDEILVLLGGLDPRSRFSTVGEVWRAVGGTTEDRPADASPSSVSGLGTGPGATGAVGGSPGATPPAEPREGGLDLLLEVARLVQLTIGLSLVPLRIGRAVAREIVHGFRPRR